MLSIALSVCNVRPVTNEGRINKAISGELDKQVKARMPVIDDFKFDSYYVFPGDNVTLTWKVRQADNVTIDNGIGSVEASGSRRVVPRVSGKYTYTLTAVNKFGTATKPVGLEVMDETKPPGILLEASPAVLQSGKMARMEWSTSAARDVSIDNGIGPSKPWGEVPVKPLVTTPYTLTAVNKAGTSTKSVNVEVTPAGN